MLSEINNISIKYKISIAVAVLAKKLNELAKNRRFIAVKQQECRRDSLCKHTP